MSTPSCPVLTDEQRAAMKPWGILYTSLLFVNVALVVGVFIYHFSAPHADTRLLFVILAGCWLMHRSLAIYFGYRLEKIIGPSQDGSAVTRYRWSTILVAFLFLVYGIVIYWW